MGSVAVSTKGAEGTGAVAALLAAQLRPGDVILLKGDLAAGKTTFVKSVASAMGSGETVTSPTFTLAQFYPVEHGTILHIDAYRLDGIHQFRDLGLDEYLDESVTLIEWGDRVASEFPCHLLAEFHCDSADPDSRMIAFSSDSSDCPRWNLVVDALRAALPHETTIS